MTADDITALLQVLRAPAVMTARWRARVHAVRTTCGSLSEACRSVAAQAEFAAAGRRTEPDRTRPLDDARRIASELAAIRALQLTVVSGCAESLPEHLAVIPDPPLALFVAGVPAVLSQPAVAIVGSRRATPAGRLFTERLAADLAGAGLAIVSGLARGIDGAAHRGAVDAGGTTVAVLGSGLAHVYPASHRALSQAILDAGGALVSEYPPTWHPLPSQFPERNRLISAASMGVVVVEASERSGSLITARLALEQGRDVMAVPGPARSPSHRGCHRLIKQGAALVESADDVLAVLGWAAPSARAAATNGPDAASLSERERRLLAHLGPLPVPAETLQAAVGLPAQQTLQALAMLELQGFVEACHGGYIRRPF